MKRTVLIGAIVLSALASGMAMADDDCSVPMAQWQPREAVEQMAKARGWTVQRIRIDDGCYQIRGQDENGRTISAKVDPGSLAVIRMKHKNRGQDNDHDHGADGRRDASPEPAPAGTISPPANGLFNGTAAPKVEVK
jgi:hypothetical protein